MNAAAAAALAGTNTWLVRRRSRLDADLPPEETQASLAKSLGIGLGVVAGMSAFGVGERKLADVVSQALARVLPGDAAIWRPVGHAAALAGFGAAARYIAVTGLHKIEGVHESVQAAFDISPPNPFVSGSYESLVPFDTLSRAGARYVWTADRARAPRRGDGRAARGGADPRVRRARERADRAGARRPPDAGARTHERVRSLVAHGRVADRHRLRQLRGGVDPRVPHPRRLRHAGDAVLGAAVAALARPRERGPPAHADARGRAARAPRAVPARPAAEGVALRREPRRVDEPGRVRRTRARRASSTPASTSRSGSAHRTSASGRSACSTTTAPTSTAASIGVFDHVEELESLDPATRERLRFVMITHYNDGVGAFGPELLDPGAASGSGRPRPVTRRCRRACAGRPPPASSRCSST